MWQHVDRQDTVHVFCGVLFNTDLMLEDMII